MPIAGSEMYERCKKEGLFSGEELDANYKRPVITTGELTSDDILNYTYMLNIELKSLPVAELRSRVALEMWKELSTVWEYFLPGSIMRPEDKK